MWQNIPMSTPLNFMPKTINLEANSIPDSLSPLPSLFFRDATEREREIKVDLQVRSSNRIM